MFVELESYDRLREGATFTSCHQLHKAFSTEIICLRLNLPTLDIWLWPPIKKTVRFCILMLRLSASLFLRTMKITWCTWRFYDVNTCMIFLGDVLRFQSLSTVLSVGPGSFYCTFQADRKLAKSRRELAFHLPIVLWEYQKKSIFMFHGEKKWELIIIMNIFVLHPP